MQQSNDRMYRYFEWHFMCLFLCYIFSEIREGIIRCILATDMARHNEILTQFQEISPHFDYSNEAHINLVSIPKVPLSHLKLKWMLIFFNQNYKMFRFIGA